MLSSRFRLLARLMPAKLSRQGLEAYRSACPRQNEPGAFFRADPTPEHPLKANFYSLPTASAVPPRVLFSFSFFSLIGVGIKELSVWYQRIVNSGIKELSVVSTNCQLVSRNCQLVSKNCQQGIKELSVQKWLVTLQTHFITALNSSITKYKRVQNRIL